jgi:hypothetical protein
MIFRFSHILLYSSVSESHKGLENTTQKEFKNLDKLSNRQ